MAEGLIKLLGALSPPPPDFSADYNGTEYKWKMFTVRPAQFKLEGVITAFIGLLLLSYLWGSRANAKRAKAWTDAHMPLLDAQFHAMSPFPPKPLLSDGPATWLFYLTGRRNLLYTHIIFTLAPRHNLAQWVFDLAWGLVTPNYADEWKGVEDEVVLEFVLGEGGKGMTGEGPGVWGVARKGAVAAQLRKDRWDVTFAKTIDSPLIPPSFILLQETADSTDFLLKAPNVGLSEVLATPEAGKYLKSLLISDVSTYRPTKGPLPAQFKTRRLILTLRLPRNSRAKETLPLVKVCFNLVDLMGKGSVKPETVKRLRKIREEVDEDLAKQYEKAKKEEEGDVVDPKKAAKMKAEAERRKKMNPEELKKLEEKEKKKNQRKALMKQAKASR